MTNTPFVPTDEPLDTFDAAASIHRNTDAHLSGSPVVAEKWRTIQEQSKNFARAEIAPVRDNALTAVRDVLSVFDAQRTQLTAKRERVQPQYRPLMDPDFQDVETGLKAAVNEKLVDFRTQLAALEQKTATLRTQAATGPTMSGPQTAAIQSLATFLPSLAVPEQLDMIAAQVEQIAEAADDRVRVNGAKLLGVVLQSLARGDAFKDTTNGEHASQLAVLQARTAALAKTGYSEGAERLSRYVQAAQFELSLLEETALEAHRGNAFARGMIGGKYFQVLR
jgi:hypothetical protein